MSVRFITQNRNDLILFGKVVAQTLLAHDPNRQWVISLQGDGNSGKSLLPLAADLQLNPHRYTQEGITDHFVHEMAAHHHPEHFQNLFDAEEWARIGAPQPNDKKIYFNDGLGQLKFRNEEYRKPWEDMLATMPDTKLVFLSNVWNWTKLRTQSNAQEGSKILIDMRIFVQVASDEGFLRMINFSTGVKNLDRKIKANFDAGLNPPQPAAPKKRAKRIAKPSSTKG